MFQDGVTKRTKAGGFMISMKIAQTAFKNWKTRRKNSTTELKYEVKHHEKEDNRDKYIITTGETIDPNE